METKGLGAGSYPEPPTLESPGMLICENCGEESGLMNVNGHVLCRDCRMFLYIKDYLDKGWEFINSSTEDKLNFVTSWWLATLSQEDQAQILIEAMKREFSVPFPWREFQIKSMIKSYLEEYKSEFCDYMDKQPNVSEVSV